MSKHIAWIQHERNPRYNCCAGCDKLLCGWVTGRVKSLAFRKMCALHSPKG